MDYARFKQLWDALVTNRNQAQDKSQSAVITNGMGAHTFKALVEYADNRKGPFVDIKSRIEVAKKAAMEARLASAV